MIEGPAGCDCSADTGNPIIRSTPVVRAGAPADAATPAASAPTTPPTQAALAPADGGVAGGGRNDYEGLFRLSSSEVSLYNPRPRG